VHRDFLITLYFTHRGGGVQLNSFLASELYENGEPHGLRVLCPRKHDWCPLNTRLDEPTSLLDDSERRKKLFFLLKFEPQIVQPAA
jgi:hypothetical protein